MNTLLRSVLVALVIAATGSVLTPAIASAAVTQPAPVVLQPTGWDWTGGGH